MPKTVGDYDFVISAWLNGETARTENVKARGGSFYGGGFSGVRMSCEGGVLKSYSTVVGKVIYAPPNGNGSVHRWAWIAPRGAHTATTNRQCEEAASAAQRRGFIVVRTYEPPEDFAALESLRDRLADPDIGLMNRYDWRPMNRAWTSAIENLIKDRPALGFKLEFELAGSKPGLYVKMALISRFREWRDSPALREVKLAKYLEIHFPTAKVMREQVEIADEMLREVIAEEKP